MKVVNTVTLYNDQDNVIYHYGCNIHLVQWEFTTQYGVIARVICLLCGAHNGIPLTWWRRSEQKIVWI